MNMRYISSSLRRIVLERALFRCEYCLQPSSVAFFSHEIDHVIAQKHGGQTEGNNLALACWRCNRHKGTDIGSFDPQTGSFSFLFNPRTQSWHEHFQISENQTITGITPEGRTSVNLLQLNNDEHLAERRRRLK